MCWSSNSRDFHVDGAEAGASTPVSLATSPCALNTAVCDGTADRILVLYSLSKQSNMAGYRTAFIARRRPKCRWAAYRKQIGQIILVRCNHDGRVDCVISMRRKPNGRAIAAV